MAIGDPQTELQAFNNNPGPAPVGGDTGIAPPPDAVYLPTQAWPDVFAKSIVVNDFQRAQSHRTKNFDLKWDTNEQLYHANVPQRYWDGTDVPRSSIGVKLVWQQLWSIMPKIRQSLFSSSDGIFFDVFPMPGTKPEQARATRELQAAQLQASGFETYFDITAMEAVEQGTGIIKQYWLRCDRERLVWDDIIQPELRDFNGVQIAIGAKRIFRQRKQKYQVNQPKVSYVQLRDFYVDPSHKLPWVNPPDDVPDGTQPGFVIQRGFKNLDELLLLKQEDKSYKGIPLRDELIERARKKMGPKRADADQHKQMAAMEAGTFQGFPATGTSDPAKYPFEVLEYWTGQRLVTLVDRDIVARNIPNPYGFIPYFAVIPWPNPNEFYGKGLAEILEGEQRTQSGIINARLDEKAMNIHGQIVYHEGMVIGKHQLRPRPGGAIGVTGDIRQAVGRLERGQPDPEAFAEVQQSQMRAEQYTGITGLAVQGAPSVPTSATRTKFGVGVMAGATASRLEYLIDKIADLVIVPMLVKQWELNTRFLDPATPLQILGPSLGKEIEINPLGIVNGQYKFEMRAASKMAAKQQMQQSLPFMLQTIFNPLLIQELSTQGTVPVIQNVMRDALDVMGWRNKDDWFRAVTPQEMQQKQQQQLLPEMLKQQKEKMRIEGKSEQQSQQQIMQIIQMLLEKSVDQAPGAAPMALASALQDIG
jgi:hypothetical protein